VILSRLLVAEACYPPRQEIADEEEPMRVLLSMTLAIGLLTLAASAQTRDSLTILQRGDTHEADQEAIAAVDVLVPGARAGWHEHAGTMVAFVAEGAVTVEQEGNQTATFSAGESFIVPAGRAHSSVNNGTSTARMYVTFITAKGKPLSSPVRSGRR
jgi:quercetin dioxygenase-like cupin family protein